MFNKQNKHILRHPNKSEDLNSIDTKRSNHHLKQSQNLLTKRIKEQIIWGDINLTQKTRKKTNTNTKHKLDLKKQIKWRHKSNLKKNNNLEQHKPYLEKHKLDSMKNK